MIGGGASIDPASNDFIFNCSTFDFDYANAPANPAHPLSSVMDDLNSVSLTLSPNPTKGIVSIKGIPSNDLSVSVINLLGETVMQQKNINNPDFSLDLSKLASGAYYIRLSSANSVVTKKVIKE